MILRSVAGGGTGNRVRRDLIGTKNGVNKVFTTPEKFSRNGGYEECLLWNGVVQAEGAASDYEASESGGLGTGFDTITFEVAPLSVDNLSIVYFPI